MFNEFCVCLFVIDNPSVRISDEDGTLFAGRKATFHCITSGQPTPTAKWLLNGKELINGGLNKTIALDRKTEGHQLQLLLQISEVNFWHAGNLICEAANMYQAKRSSIQVSVSCESRRFSIYFLLYASLKTVEITVKITNITNQMFTLKSGKKKHWLLGEKVKKTCAIVFIFDAFKKHETTF